MKLDLSSIESQPKKVIVVIAVVVVIVAVFVVGFVVVVIVIIIVGQITLSLRFGQNRVNYIIDIMLLLLS